VRERNTQGAARDSLVAVEQVVPDTEASALKPRALRQQQAGVVVNVSPFGRDSPPPPPYSFPYSFPYSLCASRETNRGTSREECSSRTVEAPA